MKDLVGVGVADTVEEVRVGQGALERVELPRHPLCHLNREVIARSVLITEGAGASSNSLRSPYSSALDLPRTVNSVLAAKVPRLNSCPRRCDRPMSQTSNAQPASVRHTEVSSRHQCDNTIDHPTLRRVSSEANGSIKPNHHDETRPLVCHRGRGTDLGTLHLLALM
jgi:hypothetical protein